MLLDMLSFFRGEMTFLAQYLVSNSDFSNVVQKSGEIGILRAMGAQRAQILRVFLIQGGMVGLLGSVLGTGIAMGMKDAGSGLFEMVSEWLPDHNAEFAMLRRLTHTAGRPMTTTILQRLGR